MTAKEYLEQLPTLSKGIIRKRQRLETLRGMAKRTTPVYGGTAVQRTREISPISKILDKVIDLEKEIDEDENTLANLKSELWDLLAELSDERFKTLLWFKYAEEKPWADVAYEIGYSYGHTRNLHTDALAAFDKLLSKKSQTGIDSNKHP